MTSHGLEAVRCRDFRGHVKKILREAAPLLNEPLAQSDYFAAYVGAIQDEYLPNIAAYENIGSPRELPPYGRPGIRDIWEKFTRPAIGQRGPFAKKPKRAEGNDLPNMCFELWPLGRPMRGDLRYCAPGKSSEDYVSAIADLFRYSIPVPIDSRWYNM